MVWFCLLYVVIFPLSGLYLYYTQEYSPIGKLFWKYEDAYIYASLLSLLSFSLITISYFFSLFAFKFRFFYIDIKHKKYNSIFYLLMGIISISTLFLLFNKFGGFLNFIQNINSYRAGGGVGAGFLQYPATMILPTILFFHMATNNNPFKIKKYYITFFVLSLVPLILLGFRGPVVIVTLQFVFFYHHFISKINFKKIVIYSLCGFFVLVVWGYLREEHSTNNISFFVLLQLAITVVVFRTRGIEVLASIVSRPHEIDYNYFLNNVIESFTSFIPRVLYEGKDISTTEKITTLYFSNDLYSIGIIKEIYGGVSSTFLGHAYWSAGLFGVIFISIITGLFIGFLQNVYKSAKNNSLAILMVGIAFSYTHFYIESFQLAINACIMNMMMYCLFLVFLPKRVIRDL